jgi:hypothetical protein
MNRRDALGAISIAAAGLATTIGWAARADQEDQHNPVHEKGGERRQMITCAARKQ